jgi:hypothetical protein
MLKEIEKPECSNAKNTEQVMHILKKIRNWKKIPTIRSLIEKNKEDQFINK